MAFTARNLSVLAYAQGFTLWHYKAPDHALLMLGRAGFFDTARDMIVPGDIVMLSARDGGKIVFAGQSERGVSLEALA
jgi:3,4-dihydroxy-2-butanone 4-phosphate synthase